MAARRGKNQARRNSGNGTPGWVWLVAGVAIAAVVFLAAPGLFKKDGEFARFGPRPNPDAQPAPVAEADVEGIADAPAGGKPAVTAPEAPKSSTQYDFYTLLPGKEVAMSDAELAASARAEAARQAKQQAASATTPPTPSAGNDVAFPAPLPEGQAATRSSTSSQAAAATGASPATPASAAHADMADATARYILQAGAFGASGDAEATKAKIAMLGLSARVESAQASGKTVYRVRMGPYGTASELAQAKQKLAAGGLPAMAIKAQ